MPKKEIDEFYFKAKSDIYGAFTEERYGDISKIDLAAKLDKTVMTVIEFGRLSILKEFDAMCHVDHFMGFTSEEWKGIQKFFALNKQITGWDKEDIQ